ncbi:hypothetical protein [Kitasatospora aureofaciens]
MILLGLMAVTAAAIVTWAGAAVAHYRWERRDGLCARCHRPRHRK